MKDKIKKFMALTMLLSFAITTPAATSLAMASEGGLLAYSMDYMPEIRASQPAIVSLDSKDKISNNNSLVSISLRDSDVKQVLRMFADKAGRNIIFKGDVKGNVTMDLVKIPLDSAFNMVMTSQNLTYTLKDNTLIIANASDASSLGKQEMALIPVKYINAAQAAHFLNGNIYGMGKPGLSNTYVASVNPGTNEVIIFGSQNDINVARTVISQIDKKPSVTSFKVNHTTPAQMADLICKMLLPGTGHFIPEYNTGGAAGVVTGGASAESGSSDSNVSTIELGRSAIACSSAIKNEGKKENSSSDSGKESSEVISLETYGITVAYQTQLGTVSITGATPQQVEMIKEFITENDKRQPQAYIEFSIIELSESGTREFDNNWSFVSKHFKFNYDASEGRTSMSPYQFGGHRPIYSTATPQLLYSLSMILKNGKGRTISNPRILVTNGQESIIDMTEDYVKTVTSQIIEGTFSSNASVERTYEIGDDLGLKISVTPFISPDGFVYLNVKPDYTTKAGDVKVKNAQTGQEDLQATLLRKNNIELKNIRVKDGDTLVLAGMMKEEEEKNVSKIPFFGDIPGLGTFFRSTSTIKAKTELVILITPKIVTDEEVSSYVNERPSSL